MREAGLCVGSGFQGTGKSYQTLRTMVRYLKEHPNRKVLIYDVNNEFDHHTCVDKHKIDINIKMLYPDAKSIVTFAAHQHERIRRVVPMDPITGSPYDPEQMKKLLIIILTYFRGGFLLIEDLNAYLTDVKDLKDVIGIITRMRHKDLDGMVHYQSLSALDTRMWQNAKYLRVHWQSDDIDRYADRIPNYELLKITQLLINYFRFNKNDERFFVDVYQQTNKITGRFSKRDFSVAAVRYVLQNPGLVKSSLLALDLPASERQKGIEHQVTRLFNYYGNPV